MKEANFENYAKYYDSIYLKMKNYRKESEMIKTVIRLYQKKTSKTLLDVGCGTAEHLKNLSENFLCTGVDISKDMIRIAKKKNPGMDLLAADMMKMKLGKKFDVIISLFSVIGYTHTFNNLVMTLKNMHEHLESNGLLIVEPWIFRKDYKKGHIGFETYSDDTLKFVRMSTSKLTKSEWLLHMYYMFSDGGEIKYSNEVHKMLSLDRKDYIRAFKLAGFSDTKFLNKTFWERSRGLFIATK
jgi:ubiquinone/menaquinone biosynthesis C-methylase UbiE